MRAWPAPGQVSLLAVVLLAGCGSGPAATTTREAPQRSEPAAVLQTKGCAQNVEGEFVPVRVSIPGVTATSAILALPRDSRNVPATPPLTEKTVFAWDAPGIKPGSNHGNVLLNTHTWPDGSAMGNRLLAGLHEGGRLYLYGGAGERLCYRVTDRIEVPKGDSAAAKRAYAYRGAPQLVIIVCSGTRLGPGDWTDRTIWFASQLA
jgi:hypothetical protein